MRELNKIAEDLFNKIRSRFENVSLGDAKAKSTIDPEKARFFNFDYVSKSGENFGNITISVVDETSLKVYFTKDIARRLNSDQLDEWYSFLRDLRQFAKRNLLNFDTRDVTRNNLQVRDLKVVGKTDSTYSADDVKVRESTMPSKSKKLIKKQHTMKNKYITEFESWANLIHEGTWKTPDLDSDKEELRKIMSQPIEVGNDGTNAIGLFDNIIGSDSLFDEFEELSYSDTGPTSDARPLVIEWLRTHGYEKLANELNQGITSQSNTTLPATNQPTVQPATESVNTIIKLAGIHTLRRS